MQIANGHARFQRGLARNPDECPCGQEREQLQESVLARAHREPPLAVGCWPLAVVLAVGERPSANGERSTITTTRGSVRSNPSAAAFCSTECSEVKRSS